MHSGIFSLYRFVNDVIDWLKLRVKRNTVAQGLNRIVSLITQQLVLKDNFKHKLYAFTKIHLIVQTDKSRQRT